MSFRKMSASFCALLIASVFASTTANAKDVGQFLSSIEDGRGPSVSVNYDKSDLSYNRFTMQLSADLYIYVSLNSYKEAVSFKVVETQPGSYASLGSVSRFEGNAVGKQSAYSKVYLTKLSNRRGGRYGQPYSVNMLDKRGRSVATFTINLLERNVGTGGSY